MATRKNAEAQDMPATVVEVLNGMAELDATGEMPVSVAKVAAEIAETPESVWALLGDLEDMGIVDSVGRGLSAEYFLLVPVNPGQAEEVITNMENETPKKRTTKKAAAAKPVAPAAEPKRRGRPRKVAEAEPVKTPAEVHKIPNAEAAREILAKANIVPAEPVSAPVSVEEAMTQEIVQSAPETAPEPPAAQTQTGLTRAQVAKEVKTVTVTHAEKAPATVNFDALIATYEAQKESASMDKENYSPPSEVRLPPLPQGVNANTWDMAYNSHGVNEHGTACARLFWAKRARDQFLAAA